MVFFARKKWSIISVVFQLFSHLNSQIPMPMLGMPAPPMFAMPPPPVHVVAMPIPVEIKRTTSTTTTTTEKTLAFAVPVPMPMPMAIGMPMPPPPPPFLPKPANKVPMYLPPPPMAMPMPAPPPVVVVPFPPFPRIQSFRPFRIRRPKYRRPSSSQSSSSCSESSRSDTSSSESSSDWSYRRKQRRKGKLAKRYRKGRRRKKNIGRLNKRRNFEDDVSSLSSDSDFVKPVLTFMSKNGNAKIKKQLSHDQAENLLNDRKTKVNQRSRAQRVQITSRKDADDPSRVLVVSSSDGDSQPESRRQIALRSGASSHILGEGKKQLVFKPPDFKKIANLSVSFQVV